MASNLRFLPDIEVGLRANRRFRDRETYDKLLEDDEVERCIILLLK